MHLYPVAPTLSDTDKSPKIIDQLQTIVNIDSLRLPTPPNVIGEWR